MIDDYTLRQLNDLMRTVNSSGMKDALRMAEEHRKALDAMGGLSLARDILEQRKLMDGYLEAAKVSKQMANAVLSMGSAARTISDSVFGSTGMSAIEAIAKVQVARHEEISSAVAKISADQVARLSEAALRVADWQHQITAISAVKGFEITAFQSHFGTIGRMVEAAEASMRLVRWENIAALDIASSLKNSLELRTARLNRSFDAFAGVMAREPEIFVAAPPFVANTPALSVFSHTEALRSISIAAGEEEEEISPEEKIWTDARDETISIIEDLLPRLSPELLTSWKGGWNAALTREKDWARQAASSFRFVLAKVIDTAAPKDRVKSDLDPKLIKNDTISRRQQIFWLCKSLENEAHGDMVLAELESVPSVINLFSEAVHKDRHHEIEKAFPRVAVRAAVALQHILEIHFNRSKR